MHDALLDGDRVVCAVRNAVAGSAGAVEGISEGAGRMYESPCVWGMKQLMQRAWEGAGLDPARLSYMECHGACVCVCSVQSVYIYIYISLHQSASDNQHGYSST
jgi:hypothetical protein